MIGRCCSSGMGLWSCWNFLRANVGCEAWDKVRCATSSFHRKNLQVLGLWSHMKNFLPSLIPFGHRPTRSPETSPQWQRTTLSSFTEQTKFTRSFELTWVLVQEFIEHVPCLLWQLVLLDIRCSFVSREERSCDLVLSNALL